MTTIVDPQALLTLAQVTGNIMSSLVEAQSIAARATVDFIDQVGFVGPDSGSDAGGTGDPDASNDDRAPSLRNVRFAYRKLDENDDVEEFEVSIPLLGLVDIPLIAIRRATIDLEYDINTVRPAQDPPGRRSPFRIPPVVLKGHVLSGRASPSDERASVKLRVEIEKADMPPGLARALDILEIAVAERRSSPPEG